MNVFTCAAFATDSLEVLAGKKNVILKASRRSGDTTIRQGKAKLPPYAAQNIANLLSYDPKFRSVDAPGYSMTRASNGDLKVTVSNAVILIAKDEVSLFADTLRDKAKMTLEGVQP